MDDDIPYSVGSAEAERHSGMTMQVAGSSPARTTNFLIFPLLVTIFFVILGRKRASHNGFPPSSVRLAEGF